MVLGDGHQRHERSGIAGGHRRPVVADGEQDRSARVISFQVEAFVGEQLQQPLDLQRVLEDHRDLGSGLLDRNQGVDPLTGDHVHDREADPTGAGEMCCIPDPYPVRFPYQPVRPRPLLGPCARCRLGQGEPVFDQDAAERGRRDPHQMLVGAAVGQLAMRAVDGAPAFGHVEDRGDLLGQQRVHRMPARRPVDQGAGVAAPYPPAV